MVGPGVVKCDTMTRLVAVTIHGLPDDCTFDDLVMEPPLYEENKSNNHRLTGNKMRDGEYQSCNQVDEIG